MKMWRFLGPWQGDAGLQGLYIVHAYSSSSSSPLPPPSSPPTSSSFIFMSIREYKRFFVLYGNAQCADVNSAGLEPGACQLSLFPFLTLACPVWTQGPSGSPFSMFDLQTRRSGVCLTSMPFVAPATAAILLSPLPKCHSAPRSLGCSSQALPPPGDVPGVPALGRPLPTLSLSSD